MERRTPRQSLPVDALIPRIMGELDRRSNLILQASPGSGKTTRVPPALLEASWLKSGQEILVLVPRRLAAKLAAYRVAEERGEEVGDAVGYQFRFEKASGPRTRLKFLTEGMLLRRLLSDPGLKNVAAVVLDEFHERHLHSDVALSYLSRLQHSERPDLKLIVMSATLDVAALSAFLKDPATVTLDARLHPVATEYFPPSPGQRLEEAVVRALKNTLESGVAGDVLVFLPGMADIRRSEAAIERLRLPGVKVLPLHGELPREQQALVFKKIPERKVILATNVAESSLTIDGVTVVIDSGLHRQAAFSWWSGVPSLKTKPVSQASAIQRAGRAGRTAPGTALRLFSQADFQGRPAYELPEIRRADLAQTLLELGSFSRLDLASFPWFEAPQPAQIEAAVELLFLLGALAEKRLGAPLTEIGRKMAALPLHPRLSRIMIAAEQAGALRPAAFLVARIAEDEISNLDILDEGARPASENVRRLEAQILSYFRGDSPKAGASPPGTRDAGKRDAVARSILCGFPDRVGQRRATGNLSKAERASSVAKEFDLVFSFGGSGTLAAEGVAATHSLFVVLDVQERQALGQSRAKVHVRSVCPIEEEWLLGLEPSLLAENVEAAWDPAKKKVVEKTRLTYGQIVLEETVADAAPTEAASRVFFAEALGLPWEKVRQPAFSLSEWFQALRAYVDAERLENLLARLETFRQKRPGLDLPDWKSEAYKERLQNLFQGVISLEALKNVDLADCVRGLLPPESRGALENEWPLQVALPSGRKVPVHYEWGRPPWIASRLQDFFGLREGPAVGKGAVPLTLHLLAPNQRALQVTSDLAGFWRQHYPKIRQELRRRYPRHQWPEDPLQTPPKSLARRGRKD